MKRFRTKGRNRLSHKLDEAYVEINIGLRHAAKKGPPPTTYLAHRNAHFDELRDLHAELAAETAVAASGGSEGVRERTQSGKSARSRLPKCGTHARPYPPRRRVRATAGAERPA